MRGPKRREIGHGALAERALLPVIPDKEEFPYALRLVSEVLSSNGSTSMASVCASTLSLMDAGVPIKAPVGGIAMGLIAEGGEYVTLTDILGAEDAFGDMDFKVAGTREFVTALQLDTKLTGIPSEVLIGALTQARDARMVILDVIQAAIEQPRTELNRLAPRVHVEQIRVAKIGGLIGPKGKRINEIQSTSGAEISIEDDGRVYIGATDGEQLDTALKMIREQMNPVMPQVGERYLGTVVKTTTFGAFISLTPGKDGLLHISRLGKKGQRVRAVEDVVNVGDKVLVSVMEIDRQNRISLQLADEDEAGATEAGPARHRRQRQRRRRRGELTGAGRGRVRAHRATGGPPGPDRAHARGAFRSPSASGPAWGPVTRPHAWPAPPIPGAPAVQGDPPALGPRHRRGHGRGRGRDRRLHLQGVHLLLRQDARPRPAPGGRRPGRHAALLQDDLGRRRRRADGHPGRDRHAQRRPRRRRPRPAVRRDPVRRPPAQPRCWARSTRSPPCRATPSPATGGGTTCPATWWWRRPAAWSTTRWSSWSPRPSARPRTVEPIGPRKGRREPRVHGGVAVRRKPTEQAHVVLGSRGLSRADPRRFALGVLNVAFGGAVLSRLFQEVREKRGLVYSIYSYAAQYTQTGSYYGLRRGRPQAHPRHAGNRPRRARAGGGRGPHRGRAGAGQGRPWRARWSWAWRTPPAA